MPQTDQQKIIEIRVRYDQAVQGIAKYTQAINQLKTEQQQLKDELKQGTISEQQYNTAMAQNREQVKAYQADIRALSREYQNNIKEQRENEGSLVSLRAQLSRLTASYDQLGREMRKGEMGENLRKQIMEVSQELKEAEAETNRFYRNVGNYESGFNGLNMSVQQILREMPNAAMSMNTFFQAISNNIPMLVDEINRLREANKAAAAEGRAGVSIWKALSGAFFSWNTAISVGVTLLTVYGGEIVKWIGNLFNAKKQVGILADEVNRYNSAMVEARKRAGEEIGQLRVLYSQVSNVNLSMEARLSAVKKLQTEYPAYFKNLTKEQILAGNASAAYRQLTNDIMAAARARAAQERIDELAGRQIQEQRGANADANWIRKNQQLYEQAIRYRQENQRKLNEQFGDDMTSPAARAATVEMYREYRKLFGYIVEEYDKISGRLERHKENVTDIEKQMQGYTGYINQAADAMGRLEYDDKEAEKMAKPQLKQEQTDANERAPKENEESERLQELQDQLADIVAKGYDERRKIVAAKYDREIAEIKERLATENNLTAENRKTMNEQVVTLEQLKNKELDKLAEEQMFKDIENERTRIEQQLVAAGDNWEKQKEARRQMLEQEQVEAEARIMSEVENEEERNQRLFELREAFNQKRLALEKKFSEEETKQRKAEAAKALKIEQEKYTAAGQLTNAAAKALEAFGNESKALTALSKTLALATVAINTGKAISEAIAANAGKPWGFATIATVIAQILSAMASASSIINSAKFATGGLVSGPGTGTSDSIPAMLSNGESVMTARATGMFAPLLSTLNQLGGGVPITPGEPTPAIGEEFLAAAIAKGMERMPRPVVSVEEINKVSKRVEVIERMGRV
jgi:myosin heavy subunit